MNSKSISAGNSQAAPIPSLNPQYQSLNGKAVLITGANAGIGAAAARVLAAHGARLALGARRVDKTEELAAELRSTYGVEAIALELDVTKEASVRTALEQVKSKFGGLSHAFNNAGVGAIHKSVDQISEGEYDSVMDVCLKGAFFCMKHELPLIAASGGGSIVNTASIGGLVGVPGSSEYVAAKHGLIGLTKSAAMEFASKGVRVNAIAPGPVMTDMYRRWLPTPADQQRVADYTLLKRVAPPEEIAEYVLFAMAGATFSTGVVFACDAGLSV
jgi:NAD(P)-dependent dehydrogenase (short-subunit alcohol dehydrogenase family)